jgi:hypothetical protein
MTITASPILNEEVGGSHLRMPALNSAGLSTAKLGWKNP